MARTGATAHEIGRLRNEYTHYCQAIKRRQVAGEDTRVMEKLRDERVKDLEYIIATGQKRP